MFTRLRIVNKVLYTPPTDVRPMPKKNAAKAKYPKVRAMRLSDKNWRLLRHLREVTRSRSWDEFVEKAAAKLLEEDIAETLVPDHYERIMDEVHPDRQK